MSVFIHNYFLKAPIKTKIDIIENFIFIYIYDRVEPIRKQISGTKHYSIVFERHDTVQIRASEPKKLFRNMQSDLVIDYLELPLNFFRRQTLR